MAELTQVVARWYRKTSPEAYTEPSRTSKGGFKIAVPKNTRRNREKTASDWPEGSFWNLPQRRVAQRLRLPVPVDFCGEGIRGTGVIYDMSETGARVEPASCEVPVGLQLSLEVLLSPQEQPLCLSAEMVRETCTGFAVRFTDVQTQVALGERLGEAARAFSDPGEYPSIETSGG